MDRNLGRERARRWRDPRDGGIASSFQGGADAQSEDIDAQDTRGTETEVEAWPVAPAGRAVGADRPRVKLDWALATMIEKCSSKPEQITV